MDLFFQSLKTILPIFALSASELGLPDVTPTDSTIETVLRLVFAFLGALAAIFIAIGGLKYTLSSGDPQGIQQAKNTILYAVIGLIVALAAQFVIGLVISAV